VAAEFVSGKTDAGSLLSDPQSDLAQIVFYADVPPCLGEQIVGPLNTEDTPSMVQRLSG